MKAIPNPAYAKASHRIKWANSPGSHDSFENVCGKLQRIPFIPISDLRAQLQFAIDSHQSPEVIQKWRDRMAAHPHCR